MKKINNNLLIYIIVIIIIITQTELNKSLSIMELQTFKRKRLNTTEAQKLH